MPGWLRGARSFALGFVVTAVIGSALPPAADPEPSLDFAYATFTGRVVLGPDAAASVTVQTASGEIVLLPNRFEPLVVELAGRDVEIEGLLLTIGGTPVLWLEAIRSPGRDRDVPPPWRPSRAREIEV